MSEKEQFDIPILDVDYHLREWKSMDKEDELMAYLDDCYSFNHDPAIEKSIKEIKRLKSGPGGIMEMKQTIADKEAEIERLKEKCDKQANFIRRLLPEQFPGACFISAVVGEKDMNGMPKYIWVVPSFGVDFSYVYEYTGKTVGGMGS